MITVIGNKSEVLWIIHFKKSQRVWADDSPFWGCWMQINSDVYFACFSRRRHSVLATWYTKRVIQHEYAEIFRQRETFETKHPNRNILLCSNSKDVHAVIRRKFSRKWRDDVFLSNDLIYTLFCPLLGIMRSKKIADPHPLPLTASNGYYTARHNLIINSSKSNSFLQNCQLCRGTSKHRVFSGT